MLAAVPRVEFLKVNADDAMGPLLLLALQAVLLEELED